MKILFLDDNKRRHEIFQRNSIGSYVTHVYNYDECILKLQQVKDFDLIFLDHDLGGEEWEMRTDCEKDGRKVVQQLIEMEYPKDKVIIIVHTLNNVGGINMYYALLKAGYKSKYRPFVWENQIEDILMSIGDFPEENSRLT